MQEFKKISLSPTRSFKSIAPDAIGSVIINQDQQVSLNLFNLPDPTQLANTPHTYRGWFFNPGSGEIKKIGSLEPAGDNLYLLYDTPVIWQKGFSEVVITAEDLDSIEPCGEILLIGYLAPEDSQSLEPFQPFSHPLSRHRWWKVKKSLASTPKKNEPNPCSQCQYWHQSCQGQIFPKEKREEMTLPTLIGVMTDEREDIQYMVHGIPGRLLRSDQPDQGKTGYLYWQPYYGFEEQIGAMGYWLCYIDPKTNQIQTPMGVTIPPG